LALIVVTAAILSIAALAQFGGRTNPLAGSSTTVSSSTASTAISSSAASSTQQESTSTLSSSSGSAPLLMTFAQSYNSLLATSSATLNYTIDIRQFDPAVSRVNLSVASTVPGVTVIVTPNEFTFLGEHEGVVLSVSVDPSVNSSTLPVEIVATTAIGVASSSFVFTLEKQCIVVENTVEGLARPTSMHVGVGQTVTWLDLQEVDDDGNGPVSVTLLDGSAASPRLVQYESWSHTFSQPGTYTYRVDSIGFPSISGTVVVS
jgi:plastocyanin